MLSNAARPINSGRSGMYLFFSRLSNNELAAAAIKCNGIVPVVRSIINVANQPHSTLGRIEHGDSGEVGAEIDTKNIFFSNAGCVEE